MKGLDLVVYDSAHASRIAVVAEAILGNLPLLTIYRGDKVGPAIIAATTISGTVVMGLARIFLLSWYARGRAEFSSGVLAWPRDWCGSRDGNVCSHLHLPGCAVAVS